jgi:hypothetical protein
MRRRRDRGFSLVVALLLVAVMVGLAGVVALSTEEDLSTVEHAHAAKAAFYAAEYALARGQGFLAGAPFDRDGGWTALLASSPRPPELCAAGDGRAPGTTPQMAKQPLFTDGSDPVSWQFCVHDDVHDPAWRHAIVVEGWGFFGPPAGQASAHLAVTVERSGETLRAVSWQER